MTSSPSDDENIRLDIVLQEQVTQYFYSRRLIPAWTREHDKFERSMLAVVDTFLDHRGGLVQAQDFPEAKRILGTWRFEVTLADVYMASGLDKLEARTAKRKVEAKERAAESWLEYSRDVKELG